MEKFITIDIDAFSQILESISKLAYLSGARATHESQIDERGKIVIKILTDTYLATVEKYSEQFQVVDDTEGRLANELFEGLLGNEDD